MEAVRRRLHAWVSLSQDVQRTMSIIGKHCQALLSPNHLCQQEGVSDLLIWYPPLRE